MREQLASSAECHAHLSILNICPKINLNIETEGNGTEREAVCHLFYFLTAGRSFLQFPPACSSGVATGVYVCVCVCIYGDLCVCV